MLSTCPAWVIESISSSNYALCLIRISAGFAFLLVRNSPIMHSAIYSLIVITADKRR